MRKLLLVASAAAMAVTMPVLAQGKGNGGGKGEGGGGGKAEHAQKPDKGNGGGGGQGRGGGKPDKAERAQNRAFEQDRGRGKQDKAERGWAKQEAKAHKQEAKAEKQARQQRFEARDMRGKAEERAEKKWRKNEEKAEKQFAKQQQERNRQEEIRFRDSDGDLRLEDRRYREDVRYANGSFDCPPGLAKKNNGCMPPGQAKKLFRVGERLPDDYYSDYRIPDRYQDWYVDGGDYSYRYADDNIYRVNNDSSLVSAIIPLLGGGFGVGSLLPSGYDVYNVPVQYRDDYYDTSDANYRYGDNAIYQVDPQSQMIEAVVALLAGDLNVGQLLPSGYDTYNLPMDYRDQYVDSDESMYRYADGNIYEVDPQTRMIEQIVAMLG